MDHGEKTKTEEIKQVFKRESTLIDGIAETTDEAPAPEAKKNRFDEPLLSWSAPLYHKQVRPKIWYIIAGVVAVGMLLYGLFFDAWTLSVLVLVVTGVFYLVDHKPAPEVIITISERGVLVGKRFYPMTMFQSFWIDYNPPAITDLHLVPNNNYKYELTVILTEQDPALIRRVLQRYIPELVDRSKSISESLSKIVGL